MKKSAVPAVPENVTSIPFVISIPTAPWKMGTVPRAAVPVQSVRGVDSLVFTVITHEVPIALTFITSTFSTQVLATGVHVVLLVWWVPPRVHGMLALYSCAPSETPAKQTIKTKVSSFFISPFRFEKFQPDDHEQKDRDDVARQHPVGLCGRCERCNHNDQHQYPIKDGQ